MPNLTASAIKQLYDTLDKTAFSAANFEVVFPSSAGDLTVIKYLDNPAYKFSLTEGYEDGAEFTLRYTPGEVVVDVDMDVRSYTAALSHVTNWSSNIRNELVSSNFAFQEIDKLKEDFEEKLKEKFGETNPEFTPEEIEAIKGTLSELAKGFEKLKKESELKSSELSEVKKELNALKNNLEVMQKKTWLRSASGKLWIISTKILSSNAGQKLLEKASDRLIEPPTS